MNSPAEHTSPRKSALNPMWVLAFGLAAMLAIVGISRSLGGEEIIPWRTEFAAAQRESQQNSKPLMLYFTADWCGPCQQMKRTVWADKEVDQALQAFVPMRIDIDLNPELAMEYQIESIPQMLVLNTDGSIARRNDFGSQTSAEFLSWLSGR